MDFVGQLRILLFKINGSHTWVWSRKVSQSDLCFEKCILGRMAGRFEKIRKEDHQIKGKCNDPGEGVVLETGYQHWTWREVDGFSASCWDLVAQTVKNPPAMQETRVRSLGREDSLEKGMATYSSIVAWRIPWTGEPGGRWSTGSQRVGHNWATNT